LILLGGAGFESHSPRQFSFAECPAAAQTSLAGSSSLARWDLAASDCPRWNTHAHTTGLRVQPVDGVVTPVGPDLP
jgi:hypothetical protein